MYTARRIARVHACFLCRSRVAVQALAPHGVPSIAGAVHASSRTAAASDRSPLLEASFGVDKGMQPSVRRRRTLTSKLARPQPRTPVQVHLPFDDLSGRPGHVPGPDRSTSDPRVDSADASAAAERPLRLSFTQPAAAGGEGASRVTAMMQQWYNAKAEFPNHLVLFRMGDFYELFYGDAELASKILGITLTTRGKDQGRSIPFAGFPFFSLDAHLPKLVRAGLSVAIVEQGQPDTDRAAGSVSGKVLDRRVVRLESPSTITSDDYLDPKRNNYLAALFHTPATPAAAIAAAADAASPAASDESTEVSPFPVGVAWADLSTGEFSFTTVDSQDVENELHRIEPSEVLVPMNSPMKGPLAQRFSVRTDFPVLAAGESGIDAVGGRMGPKPLQDAVAAGLAAFARERVPPSMNPLERTACMAIVGYFLSCTMGQNSAVHLSTPAAVSRQSVMSIDAASRRSLELIESLSTGASASVSARDGRQHRPTSLLSVVDRTVTPSGARLLMQNLNSPLLDIAAIERRLDDVSFFHVMSSREIERCRQILREVGELERSNRRLALDRFTPRDLLRILTGLRQALRLREFISGIGVARASDLIADISRQRLAPLVEALEAALMEFAADGSLLDGGSSTPVNSNSNSSSNNSLLPDFIIKPGFDNALDGFRSIHIQADTTRRDLENRYRALSGINQLRVERNDFLGFFCQVKAMHADRLAQVETVRFQRCGSTKDDARFRTAELRDLSDRLASAALDAQAREKQLVAELVALIRQHTDWILAACRAVSQIDVSQGLAVAARELGFCRPVLSEKSVLQIVDGRHPVVEHFRSCSNSNSNSNSSSVSGGGGGGGGGVDCRPATNLMLSFVPNDCVMEEEKDNFWLITAANMGGKSTFLRQNALICILAQAGSFVPASSAVVGLVDRVFSRVGAADDISRDQSTFMVEMAEMSAILAHATRRSLIICDELGRGSSPADGLAVARAVVEHIHNVVRCRTLFATHFHELTRLEEILPRLACLSFDVVVSGNAAQKNALQFTHRIRRGASGSSFGVHIARLAGMPASVVDRAFSLLPPDTNSSKNNCNNRERKAEDGYDGSRRSSAALRRMMRQFDAFLMDERHNPDVLSPRAAHSALYDILSLWKRLYENV